MPTIKDLNSRIPDGIHAECQTLRHYCYWLRELCHGAPEYLNIESVATNILTAQIFPSEEERLRNAELRFELLRFIAQAMHRTVPLSSAASQMLSAFLNAIANDKENEGRKNLILSFNYDTLIEDQIRQDPNLFSTIAVDYGVNIEPADRSACHGNRPKSIDLLKLHGSLNWYSIKGSGGELDLKNVCRIEADDRRTAELALVENLQREDLNPIEEAKGYKSLIEDYGLTQEEAAKSVGRSRPAIANSMRLLSLSPAVLELVENVSLSAGHARALVPISNEAKQLAAAVGCFGRPAIVLV